MADICYAIGNLFEKQFVNWTFNCHHAQILIKIRHKIDKSVFNINVCFTESNMFPLDKKHASHISFIYDWFFSSISYMWLILSHNCYILSVIPSNRKWNRLFWIQIDLFLIVFKYKTKRNSTKFEDKLNIFTPLSACK